MRNTDVGIVAVEIKHLTNQEQQFEKALKVTFFLAALCFFILNLLARNADNEDFAFYIPYLTKINKEIKLDDPIDFNWWRTL